MCLPQALAAFVWSLIHLNADAHFISWRSYLHIVYFSEILCTAVTFQRIILEDKGSILILLDNFSVIFQSAQKNTGKVESRKR